VKFTLAWLRDHLDTAATLVEITDTLTRIGLELESVTDRGAPLRAFHVAHVLSAVQHPNADRLRVCTVDTGTQTVTVVCGAPNAHAGMKAVFAPPGSVIPATGATLKLGEIRGVQSAGMLLSSREMALGDDHDGIVELPESAPTGTAYPAYAGLDDPVIEIAVTPNRGDALGVRGIARDLAAAGLGTLRPYTLPLIEPAGGSAIAWRNLLPAACPWVLGRTIRGVRNGPSPAWLAARLTAIGLRPISALVDVTNWFAIDLGRPLHVFDVHKLAGDLTVRPGENETFRALDGRDYTVGPDDCVIADATGVQSLGGIMGGQASGCGLETTEVFIECALFDPIRTALSGRRHQIHSDARHRFERGVDPHLPPLALDAATALIVDLCGGVPSEAVWAGAEPHWRRAASLTFARLNAIAGTDIPPQEAVAALTALGFTPVAQDALSLTVRVPSWRTDIAAARNLHPAIALPEDRLQAAIDGCDEIEPQADLAEEILRLRGLDRLPATSLPTPAVVPTATLTPRQSRAALARRVLAARGLYECVTFSFTDAATSALFGAQPGITVANPIAADLSAMRPTPLATLALAAKRNAARGYDDVGLFEIGPGFIAATEAGQLRLAAALRTGHTPRNWAEPSRPVDAYDARADALALLQALAVPLESLTTTQDDTPAHYHPGRSGTLRQGPKLPLARFGALHPAVCAALDLPAHTAACEINLAAIAEPKRRRKSPPEVPALMPVRRDYAFIVPAGTHAEILLRAARQSDRTLITNAILFDVYQLPDGQTSLAVEITLQPTTQTLTDAELDAVSSKLVASVVKATGARLR
jgi:phenylalanyl-tRNA synthetase beta chain